jgi:AbiU2
MPQHIQKMNETEFGEFTKKLAAEIPAACIDYQMYRDLHNACVDHQIVVQQSRTFWPMTLDAHLNSAVLRICRIYDTQKSSLNLAYWLKAIRDNPRWFTESAFYARHPDRRYEGQPNHDQLAADIRFASKANPRVKDLIMFRGSLVAHIGQNYVLKRFNVHKSFKVTLGDLEGLTTGALTILNRYTHLYESGEYSAKMIGADDFKFIFTTIKDSIDRRKKGFLQRGPGRTRRKTQ